MSLRAFLARLLRRGAKPEPERPAPAGEPALWYGIYVSPNPYPDPPEPQEGPQEHAG